VITVKDLSLRIGPRELIRSASFRVDDGMRIGLVGRNGAGKTTLTRLLAGEDVASAALSWEGTITRTGTIGYLPQDPRTGDLSQTARSRVLSVRGIDEVLARIRRAERDMAETSGERRQRAMERYVRLDAEFTAQGGWAAESEAARITANLGLPARVLDQPLATLSGGQRRRVELARILFSDARTLLLDEPTNHLDAETVEWLEQALREYAGTVVIVTHDRYFLDNITRWILELESGRGLPFEGNYSSWLAQKAELLRVLEKKESQRQRALQRELEWIRNSHEGRLQKNQARIKAYEQLAGQEIDARSEAIIQIAPGPRLGEKVLSLRNVCKGFVIGGERAVLLDDCTFDVPRGAIVGVIGPNGTGKTTLLRMVIGEEQPDSGTIELGPSVVLSYVDQHRDALTDENTVFEEITGGEDTVRLGNVAVNSRLYLARFNFRGPQQQKKVGECSGGERNRIHLAQMLRRGGNLLLLDEPTNDLDVNTLRVLEQAMIDFPGCALVISHDRFFLDRIATHILVLEGDGKTRWFEGNFAAYEAAVRAEDPERVSHRRSKYKRLTLR